MRKLSSGIIILVIFLSFSVMSACAQVSVGIQTPNVRVGINIPLYPDLVPVPGYPVYYAPQINANYFFYDGMYWVYLDDFWYASYWYNGPWSLVEPIYVPAFVLRIPVRYYRHPPAHFRGWQRDAPPHWGQLWGRDWEQRRRGWEQWNRSSVPQRAPLPAYQRKYTRDRYPHQVEQQREMNRQNYRYQPRDEAVRQHFPEQRRQSAPAPALRERQEAPGMTAPGQRDLQRQTPTPQPQIRDQRLQDRERIQQQGSPAAPRSQPYSQPLPQQRAPAYQQQQRQRDDVREQQVPNVQQPQGREERFQERDQRFQERERPQESRGHGR